MTIYTYSNIWKNQIILPTPIYTILSLLGCMLIFIALQMFILQRMSQKIYFWAVNFDTVQRNQFYLCLFNLPILLIGLCSVIYNHSLLGIEISLTIDQINIQLVAGYICWLQQSRQTPIRGFIFLRDYIFAISCALVLVPIYYNGKFTYLEPIIILSIYFIYYVIQIFNYKLQNQILSLIGVKQQDFYNVRYLKLIKQSSFDLLEIKDIISNQPQQILLQLKSFQNIICNFTNSEEEKKIINNFAKLILPIKIAIQEQQKLQIKLLIENIKQEKSEDSSSLCSDQSREQNCQLINPSSINLSSSDSNRGILSAEKNDDFIKQQDTDTDTIEALLQPNIRFFNKFIKYTCYPIYLLSLTSGRLRYLSQGLCLFILVGCMMIIINSGHYWSTQMDCKLSLVSLILGLMLSYPMVSSDYDFMNMFIQGMILKLMIIAIAILILQIVNPSLQSEAGIQILMLLLLRIFTYILFIIFMITKRFATRFSNLQYFVTLFVISHTTRIIIEYSL